MGDTFQDQFDDGHINISDLLGTSEWAQSRMWKTRLREENTYGSPIDPVTETIHQPPAPKQWEPDALLLTRLWASFLFGFGLAWIISAIRSER